MTALIGFAVGAALVVLAFVLVWAIELAPDEYELWPETGAEPIHVRLLGENVPRVATGWPPSLAVDRTVDGGDYTPATPAPHLVDWAVREDCRHLWDAA